MTRPLPNSLALLLCLLLCCSLQAQFKNKAKLETVSKTGFYSIYITPELSSYLKTDFSDLRIMDEEGKQAEYFVDFSNQPLVKDSIMIDTLPVIANKQTDSGKTILILENRLKGKISSIALILGNASVNRTASISGSNDGKKWFAIVEDFNLERKYTADTDKYIESINFPMVSYHYLKLVIYNGKNDPLNIITAGIYDIAKKGTLISYLYVPELFNPDCMYKQKDSADGYSYISVHNVRPFHTDDIELTVQGPRFFNREVDIIVPYEEDTKFSLASNTYPYATFRPPVFKATDWLIKIYNGSNPPLKIAKLITSQQMKNIIAWLDSGKIYHLEMNNAKAVAPHYDLQSFKDSIPENVIPLNFSAIEPITPATNPVKPNYFKQFWLWPAIILVLLVLVFFTWRLAKEVGAGK